MESVTDPTTHRDRLPALSAALSLVGAALVAVWLTTGSGSDVPAWVLWVTGLAVAAWAARTVCALLGLPRTAVVLSIAGAALGAFTASRGNGVGCVVAAVCVMQVLAETAVPAIVGAVVAAVAAGLIGLGAIVHPVSVENLAILLVALALGVLGGISRRQARLAQDQAVRLREKEVALQEEVSRIAIARDLHDVLAHSLGGLVVQLDAADALLETGDAASARKRIVSARELAAAGLGEARRAVATLRAPVAEAEGAVDAAALRAAVTDLLAAHRTLGGTVDFAERGGAQPVPASVAVAFERALQEALSNARRHAPAAPVQVRLDWQDGPVHQTAHPGAAHRATVRLTVANPVPAAPPPTDPAPTAPAPTDPAPTDPAPGAAASGGYGLVGMRERFAALAGGLMDAGRRGDRFVVTLAADLEQK